jgi:hypothetical protein
MPANPMQNNRAEEAAESTRDIRMKQVRKGAAWTVGAVGLGAGSGRIRAKAREMLDRPTEVPLMMLPAPDEETAPDRGAAAT